MAGAAIGMFRLSSHHSALRASRQPEAENVLDLLERQHNRSRFRQQIVALVHLLSGMRDQPLICRAGYRRSAR
jgi:hypothetical protein